MNKILSFIEAMRRRSDGHKSAFALSLSVALTTAIALLWGFVLLPSTLRGTVAQNIAQNIERSGGAPATEVKSPLGSLKDSVNTAAANIGQELSELSKLLNVDLEYERIKTDIEGGRLMPYEADKEKGSP